MKPSELNHELLEQMMATTESAIKISQNELEVIEKQIANLQHRAERIRNRIWDDQQKTNPLRGAMLIAHGAPERLAKARRQIVDKMKRAKRDNILVKTRARLEEEIKKEKEALKAACDHRFVIDYHGYSGTRSDDYDDARPGMRLCIVCGFYEHASNATVEDYKIMVPMGDRLINPRAPSSGQWKSPLDVYAHPLDDILESLLDSRVPKWLAKVHP